MLCMLSSVQQVGSPIKLDEFAQQELGHSFPEICKIKCQIWPDVIKTCQYCMLLLY